MNPSRARHGCASRVESHDVKYAKRAAGVLARCRAVKPVTLNPRHVVCTDTCRLWQLPGTLAFVCCDSGNVHFCGDECKLPSRVSMDNDTCICPLTHVVLDQRVYCAVPSFTDQGRPITHWSAHGKAPRRRASCPAKINCRAAKPCTADVAERVIIRCFAAGATAAAQRKQKLFKLAAVASKRCRPASFAECSRMVHRHMVAAPRQSLLLSRVLAQSISTFLAKHRALKLGSTEIAIGTMLTLLSTGLVMGGVTLVEQAPTVEARMPLPNEMGMVRKMNCRGVSMGVRNFKDYALAANGMPVYNKCFRFTDAERQSMFRALHGRGYT